jgi:hypothetical protein
MIKRTDMKIRQRRQPDSLASQRRSTPGAKAPLGLAGRRLELGDLAFSDRVRAALEGYEDGNRRTAVLSAAFTMTPRDALWLTRRNKSNRAAQAPALKSFGCAAYRFIPPSSSGRSRPL